MIKPPWVLIVLVCITRGLPASGRDLEIGRIIRLPAPVENFGFQGGTLENVRVSVTELPSWLTVLKTSKLGPVSIEPKASYTFHIDLRVSSSPTSVAAIGFTTSQGGAGERQHCRVRTRDGFNTTAFRCVRDDGHVISETLLADNTPPRTTISFLMYPDVAPGGIPHYNSEIAAISLEAEDPEVEGDEFAGVGSIRFAIDSGTFQVYAKPFTMPEGRHTISYYSEDKAGNTEIVRSTTAFFDATRPTAWALLKGTQGRRFTGGNVLIPADAELVLAAEDPISSGGTSGISRILYDLDYGTMSLASGPVRMPKGFHRLEFIAIDNTEHVGEQRRLNVYAGVPADDQPPTTTFEFSAATRANSGLLIADPTTYLSLSAQDAGGSGLMGIYLLVDQNPRACGEYIQWANPEGPAQTCSNAIYRGPIQLQPGDHTIYFFSMDRAQNREASRSIRVRIAAH